MSMLTARECHEKRDGLFLLCFPCQLYLSLNSGLLHETILTGIHIILLSTKLTVQPNHHVIDGCLPDSVKQVNCIALRLQYIGLRQDNKVEPVFLANPPLLVECTSACRDMVKERGWAMQWGWGRHTNGRSMTFTSLGSGPLSSFAINRNGLVAMKQQQQYGINLTGADGRRRRFNSLTSLHDLIVFDYRPGTETEK